MNTTNAAADPPFERDSVGDTVLFVGPLKTGTSWIHEYLKEFSDLALPRSVKETFYFDRRYSKGPDWYFAHFGKLAQGRRLVEVAPSYFHDSQVPERVKNLFPNVQIVVTLREPVRRAWSLYWHLRRYGMARGSFSEELVRNPALKESTDYAGCLQRWIGTFGRERVQILFFEDLAADPEAFGAQLRDLLQLRASSVPLPGVVNEGAAPLNERLAALLRYGADWLRERQIFLPIEMAKSVGLKALLLGRGATDVALRGPSNTDRAAVMQCIGQSLEWLEREVRPDVKALWQL